MEGLKVTKDLEVFKGVRLVPLQSSEISRKVSDYLPRFPYYAFLRETSNFWRQNASCHRPARILHISRAWSRWRISAGRSSISNWGTECDNSEPGDEIDSFQESFTQALSLILNHRIQITYRWFCLGEERTFNLRDGSVAWPRPANRFRIPTEASEADIEKAKCLHKRLIDFDSNDCTKLQIAIDRWIKSKASGNDVDRIIDLGIALEALYVSETAPREISRKRLANSSSCVGVPGKPTHVQDRDDLKKEVSRKSIGGDRRPFTPGRLPTTVKIVRLRKFRTLEKRWKSLSTQSPKPMSTEINHEDYQKTEIPRLEHLETEGEV